MKKKIIYQHSVISYHVSGNGKPVLLVHGFGEDHTVWRHQVAALQAEVQLIVPDLPGTGGSDLIADMTMEGMAEVLHAIIHEENLEPCIVIGHSMGGYITLALVEKYWNHVAAFGLFHSTTYADSEEKIANRRKSIAFVKEQGAFAFLKTSIPNLFSEETRRHQPELVAAQISSMTNFSAEALVSYYEAMIRRPDRTALLLSASMPVLFIIGENDTAVSPEDALKQSHIPGKSYIYWLSHTAHMGMLEEPELANRYVKEFLNGSV